MIQENCKMLLLLFILLGISVLVNLAIFIIAYIAQSDKFTDITYTLTFILLSLITYLQSNINIYKTILICAIILWATRLGSFLFIRINYLKKDKRFNNIRNNFLKFLGFFLFQSLIVWIILIPSILFLLTRRTYVNFLFYIGLLIWLKGFLFESISDYQKFKFIKRKNKRKFINKGLWRYSRHPNYYGEILCWIGIFITTSYTLYYNNIIYLLLGLISPIFIYILLRYISGINILEKRADKKYKNNKSYQKYKKNTPLLIPYKLK